MLLIIKNVHEKMLRRVNTDEILKVRVHYL